MINGVLFRLLKARVDDAYAMVLLEAAAALWQR